LNSDKVILNIPEKTILTEIMRIANLINFLKKIFKISVKFILKSKLIIDVASIHKSTFNKEILTIKNMAFKRGYYITQNI
jgi:hypothetical protein